ncbi:MAG TPA: hypothetical protein VNF29_16235, partial [Candidatus Binataceae bacterium]|nr:hypothetical protein [Candidatus Binataceae bacterium]
MDLKQFKFGFVLEVVNRLSPVIAQVEGQIKHLNESVKNTARMREYGENLAKIGGAIAGVGAGIGYGLYKFVEDAATMQTAISKVGATTGLSAAQLGNLKEHAEDFADSNFGVSALEYAAGFGRAYQNLHSYSAAVQAADIATRGAEATGANYAAIIDL